MADEWRRNPLQPGSWIYEGTGPIPPLPKDAWSGYSGVPPDLPPQLRLPPEGQLVLMTTPSVTPTQAIETAIHSVCSDGNSNTQRVAEDVIRSLYRHGWNITPMIFEEVKDDG